MYATEVSPDLISTVTDGVVAEVTAWQTRPLEPMYPVVFFDALRVKVRDEGTVRSKAIYLALAYTTNALESVHAQQRKIIKARGHFPSDEAATKLIWLALRNITAKWARGAIHWRAAMNQFAILYEDRFTKPHVS